MPRERLLRVLTVDPETEKPFIDFAELVVVAQSDSETETDNDKTVRIPLTCDSPFVAHEDMVKSMTKLRKHGLQMLGISLEDYSKQVQKWKCVGLKIDGDHTLKQSRIKLIMAILTPSGKWVKMPTGQHAMYPEADDKSKYFDIDKLTPIIEDIIEECWSHLQGKYGEDMNIEENPQLILFPEYNEPVPTGK